MKAFTRFIVAFGMLGWPAMGICQAEISSDRVWDLGVWAAVATGEENTNSFTEAQILSAGPFVGRVVDPHAGHGWWAGNIEYGFSVSPLLLQVRPQHLYGIAFEPIILRWNSTHELGRVIPYIELAGGAVRTNVNLPAGNTSNFNFTASGGAGFYLRSKSGRAWDLGARWDHISNADLGIQNPEFNGIQVRLAYHWYH
jgi:Lipid A 3-O-deacylase (PagL)